MTFLQQFRAARICGTPLLAIRSADPASTIANITNSLNGRADETPIISWDIIRGLRPTNQAGQDEITRLLDGADPVMGSARPTDMLPRLENVSENTIVFMLNAHKYFEDPGVLQGIWNLRDTLKADDKGAMLILLTSPGATMPIELKDDVLVLDEPLPTMDEIREIVKAVADTVKVKLTEATLQRSVDALVGLSSFSVEQTLSMCISPAGINLEALWERKCKTIEQIRGLSVFRGTVAEPVGLDNIKAFLKKLVGGKKKYRAVLFMDEIEKAFAGTGTDLSGVTTQQTGTYCTWAIESKHDGVMCIGVPGGGKSLIAKWLGLYAGIPTILFDLSGMQSGIIGSSGENLRTAQKIVDAVAQGSVLMIGTCNGIGQMPPEVLSRFNFGTFFFNLMSDDERAACWKFYMAQEKLTDQPLPDDAGWTGREVMNCCAMAAQLCNHAPRSCDLYCPGLPGECGQDQDAANELQREVQLRIRARDLPLSGPRACRARQRAPVPYR